MIAQLDSHYIKTRPYKAYSRIISHLLFQGRYVTTGHRWLNNFILAELKLLSHLPQMKAVEKPIFIIGTGRSGSTILGKVLSMHKDIGFLNEPKALWYIVDPKDDVNGHFGKGEAKYRFDQNDVSDRSLEAAHHLFGNYLTLTCSKRVLDKNPEIIFRIHYIKALFPDAKFIFLVRNGWDTIHSIVRWSQENMQFISNEQQDWWGVDRRKWDFMVEQLVSSEPLFANSYTEICKLDRQDDMAAVEWVITMQEGLKYLSGYEDSVYLLRYEMLTSSPVKALQDLCEFCELPEDKTFLNYSKSILTPNLSKSSISLHPAVKNAFIETMLQLGYPVR